MASNGTTTIDFGAFPGASDTSATITGQASIGTSSLVEAWIRPAATADHTADEHMVETLKVMAGNIVAGTGFTIYGFNTSTFNEPLPAPRSATYSAGGLANAGGYGGGKGTRLYGLFTVAWAWT